MIPFMYHHYTDIEKLREMIKSCQAENHVQQVAYSTYHDALTQVCFTCRAIKSMVLPE